jgi:PAS domain-containing protein
MGLRRELLLTISALVVLNLLLSFGSIGLFGRIGPAVERILRENVESVAAAEEILAELALAGDQPVAKDDRRRIRDALARIKENVTEDAERPLPSIVEHDLDGTAAADPAARGRVVGALLQLIDVNRDAMRASDRTARRLGAAGAWAAVFVGFLSFLLSLFVVARFQTRLLEPLLELHQVLDAVRRGYQLRRCRPGNAPLEVRQLAEAVNKLLDERLDKHAKSADSVQHVQSLALKELLERHPAGAALLDGDGRIARANKAMLELLAGRQGKQVRRTLAGSTTAGAGLERIRLDEHGWLVLLPSLPAPTER